MNSKALSQRLLDRWKVEVHSEISKVVQTINRPLFSYHCRTQSCSWADSRQHKPTILATFHTFTEVSDSTAQHKFHSEWNNHSRFAKCRRKAEGQRDGEQQQQQDSQ